MLFVKITSISIIVYNYIIIQCICFDIIIIKDAVYYYRVYIYIYILY